MLVACTTLYLTLGLSAKPYSWQTAPAAAASVYDFRPAGGDTPVAIGPNVAQATVQKLKQEVAPKPLVAKPTARQTAEKLSTVERLRAAKDWRAPRPAVPARPSWAKAKAPANLADVYRVTSAPAKPMSPRPSLADVGRASAQVPSHTFVDPHGAATPPPRAAAAPPADVYQVNTPSKTVAVEKKVDEKKIVVTLTPPAAPEVAPPAEEVVAEAPPATVGDALRQLKTEDVADVAAPPAEEVEAEEVEAEEVEAEEVEAAPPAAVEEVAPVAEAAPAAEAVVRFEANRASDLEAELAAARAQASAAADEVATVRTALEAKLKASADELEDVRSQLESVKAHRDAKAARVDVLEGLLAKALAQVKAAAKVAKAREATEVTMSAAAATADVVAIAPTPTKTPAARLDDGLAAAAATAGAVALTCAAAVDGALTSGVVDPGSVGAAVAQVREMTDGARFAVEKTAADTSAELYQFKAAATTTAEKTAAATAIARRDWEATVAVEEAKAQRSVDQAWAAARAAKAAAADSAKAAIPTAKAVASEKVIAPAANKVKAAAKAVPKVSVSVAYAADEEAAAAAKPSLLSRLFRRGA
jgi:hypothetical protein